MLNQPNHRKQSIQQFSVLYFLIFLIALAPVKTNAQVKTMNLVTDFGAVGDSTTDNTDAFVKAGIFFSNFLTNDTTGILIIPSYHPTNTTNPAVYKVGRQLAMNDSFIISTDYNGVTKFRKFKHWHTDQGAVSGLGDTTENYGMLAISNVHGLVVKGEDSLHPPVIQYKDSLYFGSFVKTGYKFKAYKLCNALACDTLHPAVLHDDSTAIPAWGCASCGGPNQIALCKCNTIGADTFQGPPQVIFSESNAGLNPIPLQWYSTNYDVKTKAWIGNFIDIRNSSRITIKDLIIDGNNKAFHWGGTWGDHGVQLPHTGIIISNSDTLAFKRLEVKNMGKDGLETGAITSYEIIVDSCKFLRNVRQGFSLTNAENVTVTNSEFNETGRINSAGYVFDLSNPGAGLDIEPLTGEHVKNAYFENCNFNNNFGPAVGNAVHAANSTEYISFNKCNYYSRRGGGLVITGRKILFDSCNIYASVLYAGSGNIAGEETKYISCHFEDKPYQDSIYWNHAQPLINIDGTIVPSKKTLFQNCTFKVNDSLREFFYLNWLSGGIAKEDWTVLDNCSFLYNNKGRASEQYSSLLRAVRFKNRNQIKNVLNNNNSYHLFITREGVVEGNNSGCSPSSLEFSGQVEHVMMSSNLGAVDTFHIGKKIDNTDGFATYETGDRALTFIEISTHVKIGDNSALRVLKGGSMLSLNKFYFGGQLTTHAGSYVVFSPSTTHYYSSANNPYDLLYIDSLTNYNQTTTSPIWTNGEGYAAGATIDNYVGSWFGYYNAVDTPPCIQGNHPQLNNALSCTPINYSHIKTHGVKSLMYNLAVPCVSAGQIDTFQFMVQGGVRPYTYNLNGSAITDTNLNNINIGMVTLIVTDATSCADTFYINMDTLLIHKIIKGCVSVTDSAKFTTNSCIQPVVTGPGTITQSNDTVTVTASGTYVITDTASGQIDSVYIGTCSDCSTVPATAEWKAPNQSSTDLFPDGQIPLNNIVLQGAISVDSLLIFNNQPDIYCILNTKLTITDSNTFICNRTKMRGCTNYWNGIEADGFGKSVIINSTSTLQDMSVGVWIKNNAFLQAKNSTYLNNLYQSIRFDNIKAPQYRSTIKGNTFKSNANLLPQGATTYCSAFTGIYAFNSTDIEVGDSTGAGNTFDSLKLGVLISGDANIGTILTDSTSRIGIYNNKFKNITDCQMTGTYLDNLKINYCYNYIYGAAIFANYGYVPSSFDARVDIRNANDTNTVIRFENCDKAIVTKNAMVTAKNLYLNNNLMGIMCNGVTGKTLKVENNYVKNGIIGMQFVGNNTESYVRNNTIDSLIGYQIAAGNYGWGTGIDIRHFTNADTSTFEVKDNDVTVSDYAGRGINMENTGRNVNVLKNDIALTKNDTFVVVCAGATQLNGISATNIYNSLIYKNEITGTASINQTPREDASGIMISNSTIPRIECNIAERTRFGITAISECLTDTDGVKGNTVHEQVLGWTFRHLGTEGTFGDVGTLYYDNHNLWTGNGQQFSVYKFCMGIVPYKIYTHSNFLTLFESNSFNLQTQANNDCPYDVADNTGASIYTCPVNFNFQQPPNIITTTGHFAHADAIAIATHTKTYSEYPEIAYWMDARKLYRDLDASTTYRHSNDTLLAFYDSLNTAIIEHIEATEDNIASMIQSMASQDYDLYIQRLDEALHSNSNVVSDEDQENNEHDINEIYLKMLAEGMDALDSDDSTRIAELAHQCPYIGGTAVYKARALYAMYAPANMFDDIAICNNIGVYKSGNGGNSSSLFDTENEYLQSLKPKRNILSEKAEHPFLLYPNPASTTVTIAYELNKNEKGMVTIYDILGREQMKIDLRSHNNKVTINVSSLRQGVYTYRYAVENLQQYAGKLLIE